MKDQIWSWPITHLHMIQVVINHTSLVGRQPRLPVDVVMGITLEDDKEDFIKNQQEIFRTAYCFQKNERSWTETKEVL